MKPASSSVISPPDTGGEAFCILPRAPKVSNQPALDCLSNFHPRVPFAPLPKVRISAATLAHVRMLPSESPVSTSPWVSNTKHWINLGFLYFWKEQRERERAVRSALGRIRWLFLLNHGQANPSTSVSSDKRVMMLEGSGWRKIYGQTTFMCLLKARSNICDVARGGAEQSVSEGPSPPFGAFQSLKGQQREGRKAVGG